MFPIGESRTVDAIQCGPGAGSTDRFGGEACDGHAGDFAES